MNNSGFKETLERLFDMAGVRINGDRPWDIRVHNQKFYRATLLSGSIGIGEAYVKGWWDCAQLDEFFSRVLRAGVEQHVRMNWQTRVQVLLSRHLNYQTQRRAIRNGQRHYDIGEDLFVQMLDKRMTYTCAYWKNADTLDTAQEAKLDLTCRKLQLEPGMTVLDIGCGWGSFAKFAAEEYGAHVTGITVSKDQTRYARAMCRNLPVQIELMDYRDLTGTYDRIVSLGMFEHVGYKNYRRFMQIASRSLKDEGLFLLHTIGGNTSGTSIDPWINKYIFPGAMLPSAKQIGAAIEDLFVMEDWHNFGPDYDKTLVAWYENFVQAWGRLKSHYDQQFYRLWTYYLLMCAGTFRSRKNQLWQIVLSKGGVPGGYVAPR